MPASSAAPLETTEGTATAAVSAAAGTCSIPSPTKVSLSDIQLVQNLIEKCLQNYMSREEVISTLAKRSNIPTLFTSLVLQQLEQQNPEFFWMYYLRLKLKDQIELFNYLLDQQNQMVENLQRFMNGMPASPALFPRPPGLLLPHVSPLLAQQIQMQCSQASQRIQTSQPLASFVAPVIKREELITSASQQQVMNPHNVVPVDVQTQLTVNTVGSPKEPNVLAGVNGSQGADLSLPMDIAFPGALFGCTSPDINLPGTSNDLMSGGGLPELGIGPGNEFQGLVDNLAYSNLDQQVGSLPNEEKIGLGVSWAMDLPKIGSFSDMAALDLDDLHG